MVATKIKGPTPLLVVFKLMNELFPVIGMLMPSGKRSARRHGSCEGNYACDLLFFLSFFACFFSFGLSLASFFASLPPLSLDPIAFLLIRLMY